MKTSKWIAVTLLGVVLSLTSRAQSSSVTKVWETDSTLKVPESVLYYSPERILYVSCIDGKSDEKDLKGSIAKISPQGKIIDDRWVVNLSAPKGMGIYNGSLYVADLTEVVVISQKSGKVTNRIGIPGSVFLNDVTIDPTGIVFVSDSRTGKVHRIENNKVSTWLEKKPGINGLLAVDTYLYMAVKDTLYKADANKKLTVITTGMDESSDGIVLNGNEVIVSCWNGVVYAVKSNGTKATLIDTRKQKSNTADIGFDPVTKMLYVPTFFKNKVVGYQLK